jgi:hypothetical protein
MMVRSRLTSSTHDQPVGPCWLTTVSEEIAILDREHLQ